MEIDNKFKAYFQYITTDMIQLNSTVIRVFKKHYPMDKEVGDVDNIMFSLFQDVNFEHKKKSYSWYIWRINQKTEFIGEMKKEYKNFDRGWFYSYINIVEKIRTGQFLMRDLE